MLGMMGRDSHAWLRRIIGSGCQMLAFCVPCHVALLAQDAFQPPQAYPAERYEAGWDTNPFTLKTAPVVLSKKSFAEDLAIGSYFGSKDDPTVVVVNTKTRERTHLKLASPAANGMTLKSVTIKPSRKDVVAEVALAEESAILRFDDSYIRQVGAELGNHAAGAPGAAALERASGGPAGSQPPSPGAPRVASQTLMQSRNPADAAALNAAAANGRPKLPMPPANGVPSSAMRRINTAPQRTILQPSR
jgi:hypothetical protein